MAGYIGNKSSVTLVDGYTETEADAEFVTKTGDSMTGNLSLGDNNKAIFGAGSDLQIYHDGSHSYIAEGGSATGSLRIRGQNLLLEDNSGKDYLNAVVDAQVELSHNGSKKFETTSTGIDVTGTVTGSTGITTGVNHGNFTPVTSGTTGARINANGNGMLRLASGGSDKMYVLDSGNVGIGTTNPSGLLSIVDSSTGSGMELQPEIASNTNRLTNYNRTASAYKNFRLDALQLEFQTSGNERMRINGSGEILIGKTSAASSTVGAQIIAGGISQFGRSGAEALRLTRTTNDGDILQFQKNDTLIGTIGVVNTDHLVIAATYSTGTGIKFSNNLFKPVFDSGADKDNAVNLGSSSARFNDIYATNGTIQTSDFNEKQDIASLTATEMLVGKRISALFKTFRWKDKVAEKGDNARTHTGVIAQDVQAAFTAEGLDAGDYALFISSTWWETQTEVPAVEAVAEVTDEDGNVTTEAVEAVDAYTRTDTYDTEDEAPEGATSKTRLGIRYPELLSFVAAYNEQRFASIEARLTALEA